VGESARREGRWLNGQRALIVDDSAANRVILREWLEDWGAAVDDAASGREALEKLENARALSQPYDLLMLDCRMPQMDGIAVARRVIEESDGTDPLPYRAIVPMLTLDEINSARARLQGLGLEPTGNCRQVVKPLVRAVVAEAIAGALEAKNAAEIVAAAPLTTAMPPLVGSARPTPRLEPSLPPVAANPPADAPALKVLLADDSADNRLLINAYFRNLPYLVDEVENGQQAIERATAQRYDVILMDIQMPLVDGYTATRTIRNWEREHGQTPVPIIAVTASALDEAVRKSFESGCNAHVSKPVRKATLVEAIREVLETAGAKSAHSPEGRDDTARDMRANGNGGSREMKKQIVKIEADLSDLIPGFLLHKREDLDLLARAAEDADYAAIAAMGHKLKGEGGSYGLDGITEIGALIEQAGKRCDIDKTRRCVQQLLDYLNSLEIVYE
jgi:CheY-like chemotaxis protein/HPt (histidine-containing phosphotransfer) domain-containing protein